MPAALDSCCSEVPEPLAQPLYRGHGHPVRFGAICLLLVTRDLRHQQAEKHVDFTKSRICHGGQSLRSSPSAAYLADDDQGRPPAVRAPSDRVDYPGLNWSHVACTAAAARDCGSGTRICHGHYAPDVVAAVTLPVARRSDLGLHLLLLSVPVPSRVPTGRATGRREAVRAEREPPVEALIIPANGLRCTSFWSVRCKVTGAWRGAVARARRNFSLTAGIWPADDR